MYFRIVCTDHFENIQNINVLFSLFTLWPTICFNNSNKFHSFNKLTQQKKTASREFWIISAFLPYRQLFNIPYMNSLRHTLIIWRHSLLKITSICDNWIQQKIKTSLKRVLQEYNYFTSQTNFQYYFYEFFVSFLDHVTTQYLDNISSFWQLNRTFTRLGTCVAAQSFYSVIMFKAFIYWKIVIAFIYHLFYGWGTWTRCISVQKFKQWFL